MGNSDTKKSPPKAPPSPPRVLLLLDAPTNAMVAGHFIKRGYSVEIVRDLRYCSIPLLKSARWIVLNPNSENSPFYQKIVATLKKMVPDRLFEQSGVELLKAVKAKIAKDAQAPRNTHPQDPASRASEREAKEAELAKKLDADKNVRAQKPSPVDGDAEFTGPKRSESPEIKEDESEDGGEDVAASVEDTQVTTKKVMGKTGEAESKKLSSTLKSIGQRESNFELSDGFRKILEPYVKLAGQIRDIREKREMMLDDPEVPEDAKTDLRRQDKTLSKPQLPEAVIQKAKQMEEKKKQAEEAGKTFPPRKLPAGEIYDKVIEIGNLQDELLLTRAKLRFQLAQKIANTQVKDYLFKIFRAIGIDADYLYGTVYLFFGLESIHSEIMDRHADHSKELDSAEASMPAKEKSSGGFSLFGGKKSDEDEELTDEEKATQEKISNLREAATQQGYAALQINDDLEAMEADMVDCFWAVYEEVAATLAKEKLKNKNFLQHLRAFLRFGLMGDHPCLASKKLRTLLLDLSEECNWEFQNETGKTNIVYPDEFIMQVINDVIPPSFDEELELSGQGTPRYKYEKLQRRMYGSRFKIEVLKREIGTWEEKEKAQEKTLAASEEMLADKEKGTPKYKALQASIRETKTELARLRNVVERIQKNIAKEEESIAGTKEYFDKIDYKPNLVEVARREAAGIRKFCKLLAGRKEPFLPFLIRDSVNPDNPALNDKKSQQQAVADFEQRDTTAFSKDLVNASNPRKSVMVRYSPTVVIMPCKGTMGFTVSCFSSTDSGRITLPLMSMSQNPLFSMLVDAMADFRYDSSKEQAGIDLMTSDTVVAAYAKVRWDYRKKSKESREKAGIYNEMVDKKNFKVHYRMYIDSIDEAGKKLFYKNYELYEAFVKYIPLPPGINRLKKN